MKAAVSEAPPRRPVRNLDDVDAVVADAHAGQADAMRLVAVLMASGIGCDVDWTGAMAWTQAAAERGDDDAQSELIVLSGDEAFRNYLTGLARQGIAFPADTWRRLAEGVDWRGLVRPVPGKIVCNDPLVAHVPQFVSPIVCAYLRKRAEPGLKRATVLRADTKDIYEDEARTNSMVAYTLSNVGLPLVAVRQRIAGLIEMPVSHLEPTNLLHYAPGEQYTHHFDSFDANEQIANPGFALHGQRVMTLLVYLNEDYESGETDFPRLNWNFRGATGEALLWRNVTDDGRLHQGSMHAGMPPVNGSKWVLSQWIREKPMSDFVGEF